MSSTRGKGANSESVLNIGDTVWIKPLEEIKNIKFSKPFLKVLESFSEGLSYNLQDVDRWSDGKKALCGTYAKIDGFETRPECYAYEIKGNIFIREWLESQSEFEEKIYQEKTQKRVIKIKEDVIKSDSKTELKDNRADKFVHLSELQPGEIFEYLGHAVILGIRTKAEMHIPTMTGVSPSSNWQASCYIPTFVCFNLTTNEVINLNNDPLVIPLKAKIEISYDKEE